MRVVALFLLAGCLDSTDAPMQNATLSALPGLQIVASVGPTWGTKLTLRYNEEAFRSQGGWFCATIGDEVNATFNGASMTIASYGSWVQDDFGDEYCTLPSLEVAHRPRAGDATEVKLSDSTRMITAHYAIDQLTWRGAEVVSPQSWTFTSGSQATLRWSHASDITPYTTFRAWYSDDDVFFDVDAKQDGMGGDVLLTFPEFTGSSRGELAIDIASDVGGGLGGDALDCTGANRCSWNVETTYRHPAALF